jgi:hypothetical protein
LNNTIMTLRSKTLRDSLVRIVHYISLAILPALAAEGSQMNFAQRRRSMQPGNTDGGSRPKATESIPYLAVIAPPSLRFRDAPAPPMFELEPVATGPASIDDPGFVPNAPQAAKDQVDHSVPIQVGPKNEVVAEISKKSEETDTTPAILPDDLRRDVRPEDILPFFQFPRGGAMIGVGVPVPAQPPAPTMPPSSATYRLQ